MTEHPALAVNALYGRYSFAITAGDGEAWVACFAADGVFTPSVGFGAGQRFRGRTALRAFAEDVLALGEVVVLTDVPMLAGDPSGGTLRARCRGVVLERGSDGPSLLASVEYHDVLVRDGAGWRFAERRPRVDSG